MAKTTSYLRWLKSLMHRLGADLANELMRQRWWEQGVSIAPSAIIRLGEHSRLEIGPGSLVGEYTLLDLQNDPLLTEPVTSTLRIGCRTGINEFNNIRAANGEIIIGDNCIISQFTSIIAANHSMSLDRPIRDQPADVYRNRVVIGNDVWIGANAVILPGAQIGNGAVIAAGAVVTGLVEPYTIASGVPAKVTKHR